MSGIEVSVSLRCTEKARLACVIKVEYQFVFKTMNTVYTGVDNKKIRNQYAIAIERGKKCEGIQIPQNWQSNCAILAGEYLCCDAPPRMGATALPFG